MLGRLGVLDMVIAKGAMPMDGCLLADAKGRSVRAPLPDLPRAGRTAYGLSRAVLDEALLHHAAACGASVRERSIAGDPVVTGGRVTGITVRPANASEPGETIAAKLVVAADGRRSMLQRTLHPDDRRSADDLRDVVVRIPGALPRSHARTLATHRAVRVRRRLRGPGSRSKAAGSTSR